MAVPTAISAVETNSLSVLFYARSNGTIASLTAQRVGEDPSNPDYIGASVVMNGNAVTIARPQIDAVAYEFRGRKEVRIYYIGEGDDGLQLMELCQTDGGDWFEGSLNKAQFKVAEDSLLSANVEWGVGDLKVFYNRLKDGKKVPAVAWVVLGQTAWSPRTIGKW